MIGQLLDGRYKVLESLAAGGFGQTYIAENTRIPGNPKCVVKQLKPASNDPKTFAVAQRLFRSEAETLAKLGSYSHSNQIPRILDFFDENQDFYLVQEFVEGHTLEVELTPGKKLSEAYVIALLQNVLPILEFIHQQNPIVIHRDIKPANIIRRKQDGKLVLIDFGAVKEIQVLATTAQTQQSPLSVAIGTPGYMPTEQGRGKPRPSSDIYALGMIAIQALTGLPPYDLEEDLQTGEILWQHQASVSLGLAQVLTKMTRFYFKDRYQSATEVLQALQQLHNPTTSTPPPTIIGYTSTKHATIAATNSIHELTLEWVEAGGLKTLIIRDQQPTKNPGTVRIGRDPQQCDIVLSEPSVSGLHVEIFFNPQQQRFYLRNLRQTNPPIVDGRSLPTGEVAINQGSSLRLGQIDLKVKAITLQQYPGGYIPTQSVAHEPITSPQPVAPTVQPPRSPDTDINQVLAFQPHPQTWRCIRTLKGHVASVRSVAISPDSQTIASGSDDNTIKLWHLTSGSLIRSLTWQSGVFQFHREATWFTSVAISPDGQTLASGCLDKSLKVWNWNSGQLIRNIKGHSDSVNAIAISRNGQTLVSGSRDNTIKVWNLTTGQLISTLRGHANSVLAVAISPDGKTIASGSRDNTIKLWNLFDGKLLRTFTGHLDQVRAVAFSADGRTLTSGSNDKTIQLLHLGSGTILRTLNGHSDFVTSVAISPNGSTLISGSCDKTIKLWHWESGQLIDTLIGHSETIHCVAISPDGNTIVSSSDDGAIKIWQVN
ncbi:MAG: FHA domain-containing protein [Aphanothece sp. CMT-3BRIN-NPC111]|jgi:serine/threonine-protein kinase|nr:FHA domain-containing protein [Aphanothece sp. CMT-3BRIN-NPC111]